MARRTTTLRAAVAVALAIVAVALAAAPRMAQAQLGLGLLGGGSGVVFDPSNFARNVLHYARRLEQMRMQEQQLAAQMAAMQKLPAPVFRRVGPTVADVDALLRAGPSLGYSVDGVDAEFRRTFPGTQPFVDYPADERAQAVRTLATLRAALDAANRAARDVPAGVARLEAMKGQLAAIRGHEAALELNGTVGVYGAEELTLLRQAVAALTNVHAVYYASEVNARAQERITYRARLAAMSAPADAHRYAPRSLRVDP